MDSGGKDERHLNIQVELDLTKPLMRVTKLKYKLSETWVEFRYEQLPNFCYYYGKIGYNEKLCLKKKHDVLNKCVVLDQFGGWMGVGFRRSDWQGLQGGKGNDGEGSKGLFRVNEEGEMRQGTDDAGEKDKKFLSK